jgi:hypothetical protein
MPKSNRRRHSRKSRAFSLSGGAGGASYVLGMAGAGPDQYNNVYANPAHTNSPTGGGMWLSNGSNVAFQATGTTPLMSGGRRRRTSKKCSRRRRRNKGTSKSWFPKLF